jgi:flagellar basal-body rod protein FlgB
MDINEIPVFSAVQERMRYLSTRQRVLAENIANADTPGFKARDVNAPDFASLVGQQSGTVRVPRVQFSPAMVKLDPLLSGGNVVETRSANAIGKPNANTVVLEEQLMTLSDVQMDYATMSNLYRKQVNMLRTALGRN